MNIPIAIDTRVAYAGRLRGVHLDVSSSTSILGSFGEVIPIPPQKKGRSVQETAFSPVVVQGRALRFGLYPSEQTGDLAILRDVQMSGVSFVHGGHSSILSGITNIEGRERPLNLSPSELLRLESVAPIILRELTLSQGVLKAIVSAPRATGLLVGEDTPRDLRPTLFAMADHSLAHASLCDPIRARGSVARSSSLVELG